MPLRKSLTVAASLAVLLTTAGAGFAADTPSADPRVKFKDGERFVRDLADGLSLPRDQVCVALGTYDCNDKAFRIVLGGVEPYDMRILDPLENASLAAPIAMDRVALHACTSRVMKDIETPASAVLFKAPAGAAAARAPNKAWMDTTTITIYDRILRRPATNAEKAQMAEFYKTVSAGRSDPVAAIEKDWVTLGCFAVASSLENTFY